MSRKTLRRATDHLAKLGLIRRMPGVGTVVTEEARVDGMSARRSLHADLVSARRTPETRLIVQERCLVDADLSNRTGFHVGCELLHLQRLRLADGEVYAILENLVPTHHVRELRPEEVAGSFLDLLRRRSLVSGPIRQVIEARMPTLEQAALLGIAVSTPLLCERISNFDANGEIVHCSTNYFHPVNYQMTTFSLPDRDG